MLEQISALVKWFFLLELNIIEKDQDSPVLITLSNVFLQDTYYLNIWSKNKGDYMLACNDIVQRKINQDLEQRNIFHTS